MRVALLPTPGHPFVLSYWLRNFNRVWAGEVDELRVLVNGGTAATVVPLFYDMGCPYDVRFESEQRIGHGEALSILLEECEADEVVLMEDDAYVRYPGKIRTAFDMRLPGVVIGSPRGGYSPELGIVASEIWGSSVDGYGLWPCFLFAERETLLRVRHGFASQTWKPGTTVPGIGRTFTDEMHTDTFSASAFMLRATNPVVHVPQYKELWQKSLPDDPSVNPPWFHSGGLSGHDVGRGFVGDGYWKPLQGAEALDIAHRVWWWRRCLDTAPDDILPDMRERLRGEIAELVARTEIQCHVDVWTGKLLPWITWDDNG